MEIQKPSRGWQHHPEEFKQAAIEAYCEPGASVAGIALANGVNAIQVRRWMREHGVEPLTRRIPMSCQELISRSWGQISASVPLLASAGSYSAIAAVGPSR